MRKSIQRKNLKKRLAARDNEVAETIEAQSIAELEKEMGELIAQGHDDKHPRVFEILQILRAAEE